MLRLGKPAQQSAPSPTPPWLEYVIYVGVALFLFGLIVLYVFEFKHFSRMLNPKPLILGALIAGAMVGTYVSYRYLHRAEDLTERIQIYVLFITLSMLFMPLFGSLSNRLFAFRQVQLEQAELFSSEAYIALNFGLIQGESPEISGYNVYFIYDNELYKTSVEKLWFEETEQGALIPLPLQQGFWGTNFIDL